MALHYRTQSTVAFPIGGHVNVLSDYKETVPEKIVLISTESLHCSRVTDTLIKFRQNHKSQKILINAIDGYR